MDRMPANISKGGLQSAITNRQAKPFTGIEIKEALQNHILTLAEKMLTDKVNFRSDKILELTSQLEEILLTELGKPSYLQKVNITYPRVGWNIRTRLHRLDEDESHFLTAEIELDLQYNVRVLIQVGNTSGSTVVCDLEEEKIPNNIPDRDRQKFGMPIFVDVNKPDGTVAKVNLAEVKSPERRAARSVDVGRAAVNQMEILVPTDEGLVGISGSSDVQVGNTIELPKDLPEVTLDDLVATPPPPPMTTPSFAPPVPSGGIAKPTKPNMKLKR